MRRRTLDVNKTCVRSEGAAREAQRWGGGGGSLKAYIALIDDDSLATLINTAQFLRGQSSKTPQLHLCLAEIEGALLPAKRGMD